VTSLKNIESKKKPLPKQPAAKIDEELPYFITLVTLMASSGISPFASLKKIARFSELLPNMSREARSMVKQVEILGMDPLSVMNEKAEETSSKTYQDFLAGYVSTVQTGGSVVHFLKSKLNSIFDLQSVIAKQLVAKLAALVDAYMIIQVVILTMYIMLVSLSSTPTLAASFIPDPSAMGRLAQIFLIIPPLLSGILMFISHKMTSSTYMGTAKILKKGMIFAVVTVIPMTIIPSMLPVNLGFFGLPYFVALALLIASAIPFLEYQKIEKINSSAERATPSILRDIAEARKTGLSPERCIVQAFKRRGYNLFSGVLDRAVNQMGWGVSLKTIVSNIRKEVSSWFVLINFNILIEIVDSGGGYADALDTLAESGEKLYSIEKEKKSMLKPYVMVAFMITGITAFTTLLVLDSFSGMGQVFNVGGQGQTSTPPAISKDTKNMFATSIVFQAYLVGLFVGKITNGTFASGFKYAILLILTVLASIIVVQFAPINLSMLFPSPTPKTT